MEDTGKPGRIANGSRPPKTLSTHHLAERAVMKGRADRGQGRAGSRRPPRTRDSWNPRSRRSRGDRSPNAHRTSVQYSTPLAEHRSSRRRGSPTGSKTRCIPRPPLSSHPSEGREEEEGRASGCVTSEEVPARGKEFDTEGREKPEGRNDLYVQQEHS